MNKHRFIITQCPSFSQLRSYKQPRYSSNSTVFPAQLVLDKMHFSLATILAVLPLLASATPLAQSPRVTIPISKRSNLRRSDGSVNAEALKGSVAASTGYVIMIL